MLQVFFMSIVVDVASEQLFHLFFLVEDLFVLLNEHFGKLLLFLLEDLILCNGVLLVNLHFSCQLLEILSLLFIVVIIVVKLVVPFP